MPEYQYGIYNPGQYPAESQAQFDQMSADGWHVHTALPNYNEVCILWERGGSALVRKLAVHQEDQQSVPGVPYDPAFSVPEDNGAVVSEAELVADSESAGAADGAAGEPGT